MRGEQRARHRVWRSDVNDARGTVGDLREAVSRWPLWSRLAWQDVLLRYRRSIIGPFWLTLSMGFTVAALGGVYGDLFGIGLIDFLPYLTAGLLVWGLIQACISEGCQTFIEGEWIIRQMNVPLLMFPLRVVCRNLVIFAHNLVIYVAILLIFPVHVGWGVLAAIPGLFLLLLNAAWCATLLGMLSARFRDLPQIVASVLQVAFLATPVIWRSDLISHKAVVLFNPFYYFLEILRGPLLGQAPPISTWIVVLVITTGGIIVTSLFYHLRRSRVPFWV
ncbi:ABC transporter permease (plasmid) [Bradyrhizobium sp. ISRA443]|uniref:ABC transporter permease n=1 Tax=unclassified Bradyrhizobium TaxID=2631580 RepID=UPI0024783DBC|nr:MULTISPECIES: ABC transporter permease [unclassified Bradyrhizobium]WGR90765.1 ABC transporter permease [Bradyrhizobium sp. ISRA435]WGS03103.1 ABC transporter permease [Bradyrhizobium sp. ISRA436]WGS09864.1 ABC transporter permease [Bradyrhizobium sp. ISRA437]WGS16749.1 ABC transporter permease [Bradyrhizobium sp. ISRA443]